MYPEDTINYLGPKAVSQYNDTNNDLKKLDEWLKDSKLSENVA